MSKIHPTAIVEQGAELGLDVEVGPYSHIRAGARIGNGTRIQGHVNIWGESEIGEENEIYPNCIIGAPPQVINDLSLKGRAVIGNKNVLREGTQIHRGSSREDGRTVVGNDCFIMSTVHIAHDCKIGNKVVIASHSCLAGHVKVEDFAIISGACGIAQFGRVGAYSYCAGMTRFLRDLPPYMCAREFSEVISPNLVGLKRAGFSETDLRVVKEIYKAIYIVGKTTNINVVMEKLAGNYGGNPVFDRFETFIRGTKNGIMKGSD